MARYNGRAGELIPRAPLREVLERLIAERADRDHMGNGRNGANGKKDPLLGGRKQLAREISASGVMTEEGAARALYRVLEGEFTDMQREVAEKILDGLDMAHLWYTEPKLRRLLPRGHKLTPAERKVERERRKQARQNTCVGCGKTIDWTKPLAGVRLRFEKGKWARPYCVLCAADAVEIPEREDVTGRTKPIPNDDLRRLYKAYVTEEVGVQVIAERVWQRYGYKSVPSCASGLTRYWRSAGLPIRPRWHSRTMNRKLRPRMGKLTKRQVEQAWVIYSRTPTMSLNELGKRLYKQLGYKTHASAAGALATAFKDHGFEVRGRIEQVVLTTTTNGLSPRDWKERRRRRVEAGLTNKGKQFKGRCAGTTPKGKRCKARAMDSGYCFSHDPARAAERDAITARMRSRSPRQDPANLTTFAEIRDDLLAFEEWHGRGRMKAARALGEAMGLKTAHAYWTRPLDSKITWDKVREIRAAIAALTAPSLEEAA
jgi:ribosomal protein L34E